MQNNDGKHIISIIDRQGCQKHDAAKGMACWVVAPSKVNGLSVDLVAICNQRAVLAGANGKISESSYQASKRQLKNKGKRAA